MNLFPRLLVVVGILGMLPACGGADQNSNSVTAGADGVPRTAWGTPNLNGWWDGGGGGLGAIDPADLNLPARDGDLGNFEKDFAVMHRRDDDKPQYIPELWPEVRHLDYSDVANDPVFICLPAGVPRIGAPQKIVQTENEVVLFNFGQQDIARIVPLGGHEFRPEQLNDLSWYGHARGHWEGDTLVVESVGFGGEAWLGWSGWLTSMDMRVIERIWREGDQLHWEATVHDPILLEPWTAPKQVRRLNTRDNHFVFPALVCDEKDADRMIERHVRG